MKTVAIRLEGGIGDHLLGMRLLSFIKLRYPDHELIVYSDCGGSPAQLSVAAMSPFVSKVYPVFRLKGEASAYRVDFRTCNFHDETLNLEQLRPEDRAAIAKNDIYVDTWGESFFVPQCRDLHVPFVDVLSARPQIEVPQTARDNASALLKSDRDAVYVALHLAKHGAAALTVHLDRIAIELKQLLQNERVMILNIFSRSYEYAHAPESQRKTRMLQAKEESVLIESLCSISERVLPITDVNILTVAALLERSSYFIGFDSGIKHLAWALDVPRTLLLLRAPRPYSVLRWMPDVHCAVVLQSSQWKIARL